MSQKFNSVWDALTDTREESASMKARSEMMMVVVQAVESWKVTQKAAGDRLGITQPRVNDLLSGRISRFNMEALFDLASKAGLTPAFIVQKDSKASKKKVSRVVVAKSVKAASGVKIVRSAARPARAIRRTTEKLLEA